jgi:hypothetical protein
VSVALARARDRAAVITSASYLHIGRATARSRGVGHLAKERVLWSLIRLAGLHLAAGGTAEAELAV